MKPDIIARQGKWLTNGQGVYTKDVHLGKFDKAENWYEITEAEYEEILKQEELANGNFED